MWDPRAPDAPAAAFLPAAGGAAPDAWCVAIGNAHSAEERCVLAGYANGDIKMFDLRSGGAAVRWETNVGKGVCGVQVGCAGSVSLGCLPAAAAAVLRVTCGCSITTHIALVLQCSPAAHATQLSFPAHTGHNRSLTGGTSR